MNKEEFEKKMQPYIDENIVSVISSNDNICILNLGDIIYVACTYVLVDNTPMGIRVLDKHLKQLIENNELVYSTTKYIYENLDEYKSSIINFNISQINTWKNFIDKNKQLGRTSVDKVLEEEILSKYKGRIK